MFTPSLQPAAKQMCGANHGLLPLAHTATERATQKPTHSTQHSLFSKADKKHHFGAFVAAPSIDAELHIETTTIMFADVVESVRLIEHRVRARSAVLKYQLRQREISLPAQVGQLTSRLTFSPSTRRNQ